MPRTPLTVGHPHSRRTVLSCLAGAAAVLSLPHRAKAADLPTDVPKGTKLVVADQNEVVQTLMTAAGEQTKLAATVTYANFLGGPAILEAFRAGALDLASIGNTPPVQAQAAGEVIPIVAARTSTKPDYNYGVRPGLKIARLEDLRGKNIAYAEGTGRQPFVLTTLKLAGLTRQDVTLVPLRSGDFPDAVRSGQVDIAALDEAQFPRYLANATDPAAATIPDSQNDRLPRGLDYLYASGAALKDPAKTAAIRDFILHWIAANKWAQANIDAWVDAYYVKHQRLSAAEGHKAADQDVGIAFPTLTSLVATQQAIIDVIYEAGDIPKRMDARDEFDFRFDAVVTASTQ